MFRAIVAQLWIGYASGQCYLEDSSATCAVCWRTTPEGFRTVAQCPPGSVEVDWIKPPPEDMFEDEPYDVKYKLTVNTDTFPLVAAEKNGQQWDVPHSNIHSCSNHREACTPFVQNTTGLSTHTAEVRSNLTGLEQGNHHLAGVFESNVKLPSDDYTIIAHGRFFVPSQTARSSLHCFPDCVDKYDVCVGVRRTVSRRPVDTSTDSYLAVGFVGGSMFVTIASILWASRKGKLELDALLNAILREEVGYVSDIILVLGECASFAISLKAEILMDESLRNLIPAAVLFAFTGVIVSLYTVYVNSKMLWMVWLSHYQQDRFFQKQANFTIRILGYKHEVAKMLGKALLCARGRSMLEHFASAQREIKRHYLGIVTMIFFDTPSVVLSSLVLTCGEAVTPLVVVALVLCSCGLGSKASSLSFFPQRFKTLQAARQDIEAHMKSIDGSRAVGQGQNIHRPSDIVVLEVHSATL